MIRAWRVENGYQFYFGECKFSNVANTFRKLLVLDNSNLSILPVTLSLDPNHEFYICTKMFWLPEQKRCVAFNLIQFPERPGRPLNEQYKGDEYRGPYEFQDYPQPLEIMSWQNGVIIIFIFFTAEILMEDGFCNENSRGQTKQVFLIFTFLLARHLSFAGFFYFQLLTRLQDKRTVLRRGFPRGAC